MFKTITLLTRRPGMSRDAFIQRYEGADGHARIGEKYLRGAATRYVRRYLCPVDGTDGGPDVVMEIWYPDRASWEATMARLTGSPEIVDEIATDEAALFDRDSIRSFLVEEHESHMPPM